MNGVIWLTISYNVIDRQKNLEEDISNLIIIIVAADSLTPLGSNLEDLRGSNQRGHTKRSSLGRESTDEVIYPDSKVHGANMGPIWGRKDPGGPHVDPMNFVI